MLCFSTHQLWQDELMIQFLGLEDWGLRDPCEDLLSIFDPYQ